MAYLWPKFQDVPNVAITADYTMTCQLQASTLYTRIQVLIASRFEEEAVRDRAYINHNTHLFDMPPPQAWKEGKQFGDSADDDASVSF